MHLKSKLAIPSLLIATLVLTFRPLPAISQPSAPQGAKRAYSVPELFNDEAAATDPTGIHTYSRDLIKLVLPEQVGEGFVNQLSDRLAKAEQAAREGKGKLVPEAKIARAFNDLMKSIGAPPSVTTTEESLRQFREHGRSINALPALLSSNHNGRNCNPGEAVFLVYILVSTDGAIPGRYLDDLVTIKQSIEHPREGGLLISGVKNSPMYGTTEALLFNYSTRHGHKSTIKLFDRVAHSFGF